MLLIEHEMKLVMRGTDRIIVVEFGTKIADDVPSASRADPAVIAACLGQEESDDSARDQGS